ncbi:hypothetical protein JCM10207_009124 [Rhodosporidiobolus poonsookiae]
MGLFLRGRVVTWVSVLLVALCAGFSTFFYAWNFSRKWPNPSTMTKIVKVFAMIFAALFSLQSFMTVHSLRLNSRSLSFGLWAMFGMASLVLDMWWFALMVSRSGFDAVCGGTTETATNSTDTSLRIRETSFFVHNLYVRDNSTTTTDDSTPDYASASCSRKNITICFVTFMFAYSLLRLIVMLFVFHFDVKYNEALPTTTPAAAPAMTAAPAAAPATVARSLAKRLGAPFSRFTSRRGAAAHERGLPLISVSYADAQAEVDENGHDKHLQPGEADEDESSVLFDADPPSAPSHHGGHKAVPTGDEDAGLSSSSSEESDDSDEEEQKEYERRRRERKGLVGAEGRGGYAEL